MYLWHTHEDQSSDPQHTHRTLARWCSSVISSLNEMSGERRTPGACYPTNLTSQWAPELVRASVSKGKWRVTKEFTLHGLLALIYVCALAYPCAWKKRVTVMDAEASSLISNSPSLGTSSKDPRGTCSNGRVRVAKWHGVWRLWPFASSLMLWPQEVPWVIVWAASISQALGWMSWDGRDERDELLVLGTGTLLLLWALWPEHLLIDRSHTGRLGKQKTCQLYSIQGKCSIDD